MKNIKERDEKLLELYAKYLLMPLAEFLEEDKPSVIYNKGYVILKRNRVSTAEFPYRHYTLEEFEEKITSDEMFKEFCVSLKLPK